MGGLLGTLAFVIMGVLLIVGGGQILRNGMEISKGKRLTGPGATVIGIVLIFFGIGVPVAAAIWLW